ncbi:MAG: tetratricopeptide repeat protein [Bradyrhizobium sp.]
MSNSPHNPSSGRRHPGDEALERAVGALQMNRPGEAERLAAGVLRANRNNHMAAKVLGWALLAQNRAADAIAPVERAARRSNDPEIETVLAVALAAIGRQQEALDQLRQTTDRRPAFAPAFREYAGQLVKLGRFDEAIEVIEGAIALAPDVIDLQLDLARLRLNGNDRVKARLILSQALSAAPGRPDILAALARVMLLDGDYAAAADMFRHLLALRPDDAMTRADLGACQLEMGARDAGESTLRAATRGRPDMLGRAVHLLAATSHGRCFFRPSAAVKFLGS